MCIRAAVAGRRFFAASSPWMEMMTSDLDLGGCLTDTEPRALAAAFRRALDRSRVPIDPDIVSRLRRLYSLGNVAQAISERVRVRAGATGDSSVTWDWVLDAARDPTRSSIMA